MDTKEAFDFPVARIPMTINYKGKELASDKDAIVRTDLDKIIGYVSAASVTEDTVDGTKVTKARSYYKIVEHAELVHEARAAIKKLGLEAKESTYLVNDGAKMYYQFDFDAETMEPIPGDFVSMRLTLVNSYDLTKMAGFELGGKRLVCTNGLATFQKAFFYMKKHAGQFSIDSTIKNITQALDTFQKQVLGFYKVLGNSPLEVAAGIAVIKQFIADKTLPEKYGEMVQAVWENPHVANKLIQEKTDEGKLIPDTFRTITMDTNLDSARTLWTFYNAFTLILTHAVASIERRMLIHDAIQKQLKGMVGK